MVKLGQFVVPGLRGGWSVRTQGAIRASKTYPTQEEAIANARERALRDRSRLYIFGSDGQIRERISFEDADRVAAE